MRKVYVSSQGIEVTGRRLSLDADGPILVAPVSPSWIPRRPRPEPGSEGSLMTVPELEALAQEGAGRQGFQGGVFLAQDVDFRLSPIETNFALPDSVRERHLLIVGKTGSGKTTKLLLPMLWADLKDPKATVIWLEGKGETTGAVLEMARKARGPKAKVVYISFTEPERSTGWNPIWKRDSRALSETASALCPPIPKNSSESPFWRIQGTKVMRALIGFLQCVPDHCNLHYIYCLLSLDEYGIATQFDLLKIPDKSAFASLLKDNVTALSIRYEVQTFVEQFGDSDVGAVTSTHEFDFDELLEPMVLVLRFPEGMSRLTELNTVFIRQLLHWVTTTADASPDHRLRNNLSIYLDEFASALGPIPDMSRVLNTFRSRGCRFTAAIQHHGQLESVYGSQAQVIAESFGTLICVPPVSGTDSRLAASRSGTIRWNSVATSAEDDRIVGETVVQREVLTASEIGMPPKHTELGSMVTMLLPERNPLLAFLPAIWQYPEFQHWDRARGGALPKGSVPLRKKPLTCPDYNL